MKKINFDFIPQPLRLWTPPLIGIPAMLLLGFWFPVARFFLFTHHLFWMIGIFLLINPVAETFWRPASENSKRKPAPPQPSSRARRRAEARQRTTTQTPAPAAETPAERLARLQKQKEAVEQKIEKLTTQEKERLNN